ncbi:AAA family ATPase [Candidatus Pacearchaeota archaeon]|nr:AAA family ATPase [Candidatus Pacearchaeota archaeon]
MKTKKKMKAKSFKKVKLLKNPPKKSARKIKKSRVVVKYESAKVLTGIQGFDAMIKGGFDSESINLVAGTSGSGKTIFAMQYLLEGVKKGESTLLVTFEEKKEELYRNMKKFGWDLDKAEKEGKFVLLEYTPEKVKQMLDEGGGAIENAVLKYNVKRLVIDSITSFSLMFDDELSRRQAILSLFDIIMKWNCTTLITVQHNPSSSKDRGMSDSEFEADSIVMLYYVNIKGKRQRFIEVLKMRGTDHSKEIHSFDIKNGIYVGRPSKEKIFDGE